MNEVKPPKKQVVYAYIIGIVIIVLLNILVFPKLSQLRVTEVGYDTFISMTENKEVGKVQIQDNKIVFTNKDNSKIYKTGRVDDSGLIARLYYNDVEFSSEIIEEASPLITILTGWLLPFGIMILIGQFISKKMMKKWVAQTL